MLRAGEGAHRWRRRPGPRPSRVEPPNAVGVLGRRRWSGPSPSTGWSTRSFLPRNVIRSPTPTWLPFGGYARQLPHGLRSATSSSTRCEISLAVTVTHGRGRAALRVPRRAGGQPRSGSAAARSFILALLLIQMIPAEGLFIAQYKMLEALDLLNTVVGLTLVYVAARAALHDLDAARLRRRRPGRARGGGDGRRLLAHAGVLPRSPSRCSRPAWSRPASSPSSRPGTSSPSRWWS